MTKFRAMIGGKAALFATPALAQADASSASGATSRVVVVPYIEATQIIAADLSGDSNVLTYTSIAEGVDAAVATARVNGQVSYR